MDVARSRSLPEVEGVAFRGATAADWPVMAEITNEAGRADGVEEVYSAESLASEFATFDVDREMLIAEAAGTAIAFGMGHVVQRDETLVGELHGAVRPSHRRRGIGTALLRRTTAMARAALAADPRPLPRELRSYAMDSEAATIALLTAEGFVPVRFGYEMRRFLTGTLPEHALPAGVELRPVVEADHRRIFDANEEAFLDHWGHRAATEADVQALLYGPDMTPDLWCVAWDGDEVAGVVVNTIRAEENAALGVRRGWLDRVSVRRPWRGRGVAKALCCESFRVLREHGMDEAWLGVDGANPTGAVRLYEGLGFHVARGWKAYGRPVDAPAPPHWRSGGDRETMGA